MRYAIALVAALMAGPAAGQGVNYTDFHTGATLVPLCEKLPVSCQNYVNGVVAALTYSLNSYPEKTRFCLPQTVPGNQLALVASKYMRDNPAELHLGAVDVIFDAMRAAFPCR